MNNIKIKLIFIIFTLFNISIFSQINITDSLNQNIILNESPKKIISISPAITELIYLFEAEDLLIGRSSYCDYPDEVLNIESIGGMMNPDIERIIELNPDIVLVSTHFNKTYINTLKKFNIKVIALYGEKSFDGIYFFCNTIGKILSKEDKTISIIDNIKNKVEILNKLTITLDKPTVYYAIGFGSEGDFTAGKNTFINDLIQLSGGNNIAKNLLGWKYSIESLIINNPDIIICSDESNWKNELMKSKRYNSLSAVKNNKIFPINRDIIDRQGSRTEEALDLLFNIFHKEVINNDK